MHESLETYLGPWGRGTGEVGLVEAPRREEQQPLHRLSVLRERGELASGAANNFIRQ